MADVDRYKSLVARQKKRVAYGRKLVPLLKQAREELHEGHLDPTSYNALSRWLTANGVKPSEDAREGARFAPQTLKDYLFMDGLEPTDAALWEDSKQQIGENQKGQKHRIREEGFRVSAKREFLKCEAYMRAFWDEVRYEREREQLDRHLADVETVACSLRKAVGL